MTKRLISLILALMLCLSLLAGCGEAPVPPAAQPTPEASPEPTPEPTPELAPEIEGTPFAFTRENMPLMDGSTSLVPLAQAAASVLLGENRDDTEALTQFNRTSQSYRNLMWDYCDILIASVPAESVFEELEQQSFAYEMEPIATDALIFVVNEANGVDNLTTEEIIGIYSGEITNWSQVGGADEPIAPFQRNAGAGSQALMEKLVMKDVPMMTPPAEYMAGSMGMLMEYVKSYDNSANAIGYSVYYYANDMRMADGLKIISVDGVEPTDENIRSGAYPHLSNYYTVIAADEPSDSPARVMFEWLQSAEGQRLVEREGYVPVMDLTDAPEKTATSGGFVVKTDWSALGDIAQPQAKFTRLQEEWIDALAPADDYGAICPFVGRVNYDEWGGQQNLYGLFDENGRIICDPVYIEVERCCYYTGGGVEHCVPMLMLGRSEGAAVAYTLASLDGSFVSPESYFCVMVFDFGILCARNSESREFVIYDFEGNVLMTQDDLKLGTLELNYGTDIYDGQNGYLLAWLSDGAGNESYLIDAKGNVLCGGWYSADFVGENAIRAYLDGGGYSAGIVDFKGEWTVPHRYNYVETFDGGYCGTKDSKCDIYALDGREILKDKDNVQSLGFGYVWGGTLYLADGSYMPFGEGWERVSYMGQEPLVCFRNEDGIEFMDVESGKSLRLTGAANSYTEQLMRNFITGPVSALEYIVFWDGGEESPARLISWDLENVYEFPAASYGMSTFETVLDRFTGEEYVAVYRDGVDRGVGADLYTADMELYAEAGTWDTVWNGCLMKTDESFFTCWDKSGEVLFCYPLIPGGGD